MAEKAKFFDSVFDSDGKADLTYNAAEFAEFYAMFYSKGIINTEKYPDSLLVTKVNNTTVNVKAGCAIIGGYQYINDDTQNGINITVTDSEGYIILRLDIPNRKISAIATNTTTYVLTDVKLAYYKVTNGVLEVDTSKAVYSKALYTHDFDRLKAEIIETKNSVGTDITSRFNAYDLGLMDNINSKVNGGAQLNATKLNNKAADYYLNYNNLTNAPMIRHGTSEPTDTLGENGDIYILYEE